MSNTRLGENSWLRSHCLHCHLQVKSSPSGGCDHDVDQERIEEGLQVNPVDEELDAQRARCCLSLLKYVTVFHLPKTTLLFTLLMLFCVVRSSQY